MNFCCWHVSVSCSVYLKILFLMLFNFQPAEDTIFEVLFWIVVILSLDGTLPEFLSPHTSRNPCLSRTWELPDSTNVLALALHLPCIPFSTLYTQMKSSGRGKVRLRGISHLLFPFNGMCLLDWPFREVPYSVFLVEHWSSSTICPASWLALVTFT